MSQDQGMPMTIMLVYRYAKTGHFDYVLFVLPTNVAV